MAKYDVPLTDGAYNTDDLDSLGSFNNTFNHQISFNVKGSLTQGTLTVLARASGSETFEPVPNGIINLATPQSVLFQFIADGYQFVVSGSDAAGGFVTVSDIPFGGV